MGKSSWYVLYMYIVLCLFLKGFFNYLSETCCTIILFLKWFKNYLQNSKNNERLPFISSWFEPYTQIKNLFFDFKKIIGIFFIEGSFGFFRQEEAVLMMQYLTGKEAVLMMQYLTGKEAV